jgi:hypothetical protein
MTIATMLCLSLLCAGVCASGQDAGRPVIACNVKAISAAERPHYMELMKTLRRAVRDRRELPTGYTYVIDSKTIGLKEVTEWITMERLCCPFLDFQLSISSKGTEYSLALTGPEGVKPLLQAEFPAR